MEESLSGGESDLTSTRQPVSYRENLPVLEIISEASENRPLSVRSLAYFVCSVCWGVQRHMKLALVHMVGVPMLGRLDPGQGLSNLFS